MTFFSLSIFLLALRLSESNIVRPLETQPKLVRERSGKKVKENFNGEDLSTRTERDQHKKETRGCRFGGTAMSKLRDPLSRMERVQQMLRSSFVDEIWLRVDE